MPLTLMRNYTLPLTISKKESMFSISAGTVNEEIGNRCVLIQSR
jgi:hypothetical protein